MDASRAREVLATELARLDVTRDGLESRLSTEHGEGLDDPTGNGWAPADAASDLQEREVELSVLRQIVSDRRDVIAGLDRLADARYGWCQTCGAAIDDERLEAVPATSFCCAHERSAELSLPGGPRHQVRSALELAVHLGRQNAELVPDPDDEIDDADVSAEERAMHTMSDDPDGERWTEPYRGSAAS